MSVLPERVTPHQIRPSCVDAIGTAGRERVCSSVLIRPPHMRTGRTGPTCHRQDVRRLALLVRTSIVDEPVIAHRTTGSVACSTIAALRRALNAPVTAVAMGPGAFHNTHFQATTAANTTLFVKVFTAADYWQRAITAAAVTEQLIRTPRLLDHGELRTADRGNRWWISYEWLDLTPFTPTPRLLEQAGEMLGWLHAATRGQLAGFDQHDLDAEITERAGHLASIDRGAADRIRALHAQQGPARLPGTTGLIHGDLHFGNLAVHHGEPILLDMENVRAAPPIVDFSKLLDLGGLDDPAHRDALFTGYTRHAPPVLPWPCAMRSVRLWTTAGVLVYAHATGLSSFAAHGYRRLAELEADTAATR